MKHTPGPWEIDIDQKNAIVKDQGDGFTNLIAETYAGDLISDARLIASAPDLLEACKRVNDWLVDNTFAIDRPASLDKELMEAIKKAEG